MSGFFELRSIEVLARSIVFARSGRIDMLTAQISRDSNLFDLQKKCFFVNGSGYSPRKVQHLILSMAYYEVSYDLKYLDFST